ncbi:unnamed protein product [Prorocentrum cordatum]|uniref:Uncharacterized protein n=1 Tax=Prorocentrum cordatum TaxID=2364126 RepID=A0ABN9VLJ9_9DINO|nr:unnamed protein product [Polarella glacialis]
MAVRRAPPGAMALLERARHCVTDRSLKTTALVVQRTVRAGDISMDSCAICMEDLLTSKPTSGSPVSNAATVSISAASCGGWRAREPPGARSAGRSSSEAPACEAGASGGGPRAAAPASAGRRADPSWGPPMGGAGRRAAIATEGAAAPWPRSRALGKKGAQGRRGDATEGVAASPGEVPGAVRASPASGAAATPASSRRPRLQPDILAQAGRMSRQGSGHGPWASSCFFGASTRPGAPLESQGYAWTSLRFLFRILKGGARV